MSIVGGTHGAVHRRRVRVLATYFAGLLPPAARVLDVGCGDGLLARRVMELRPDVQISGIDVLVRPQAAIPVKSFDGTRIPAEDGDYDVTMLVDVLHHANDPKALLREAARATRQCILIKDHTRNGFLAGPTLRFMDDIGNARFGVDLPHNYWTREQWKLAFHELQLNIEEWRPRLGLYPVWADWLFGRSLHFVARLSGPRDH